MWFLLLLLSTASSLIRVDGRPQGPDISKLPPSKVTVSTSREFLTRGADGASLSETEDTTETPSITIDPTEPHLPALDSAAAGEDTESQSSDPEPAPSAGEDPSPDAPSGEGVGDGGETLDTEESSAAGTPSSGAASSEDFPGGQEEAEVSAVESSTASPSVTPPPPPPDPEAVETEAPELEAVETEAPELEAVETKAPELEAGETEAPELEAVETETPESAAAETEAPKSEAAETEAPDAVVAETEAPQVAAVETEAPEAEKTETEAPEPTAVETEAPESAQTAEPEPMVTEPATEAAQETEEPVVVPGPAAAEEVASTEPAPEPEESATEAAPAVEDPITDAAITPERPTPTPPQTTDPPQFSQLTTAAAEEKSEGTTSGPEQKESPVSAGGPEQGKAESEVVDGADQVIDAVVLTGAEGGEERTGKLTFTEPPGDGPEAPTARDEGPGDVNDGSPSPPGAEDAPKDKVKLEEVYNAGVKSQMGQSSLLTEAVKGTMKEVFFTTRYVGFRLGKHKVVTRVNNLTVEGINKMRLLEINSSMDDMSLNVTFEFPEITFRGRFNATGSILNNKQHALLVLRAPFPTFGHGNIMAKIFNSTAVSQAELIHSFNDRKLSIERQTCRVSFGEPEVKLTELNLPRALRKLHFEHLFGRAVGKMISLQLKTVIEPKVDESLHDVITSVLDRVSLDEQGAATFLDLETNATAW